MRGAAVHAQLAERDVGVPLHRPQHVRYLVADAVQRRTHDLCPVRRPRHPIQHAHGGGVPVRRAQAGERRHQVALVALARGARELLGLTHGLHEPHVVLQPRHDGTRVVDVALQDVAHLAAQLPREGGDEAAIRRHGVLPHVHHDRGAGAIRRLHHARPQATLPKQRAVGVAHHGVNGDGSVQIALEVGHAKQRVGVAHLGKRRNRDAERVAQFLVPRERVYVEELRPRRVRVVRLVRLPMRQPVHQVRVNRAQAQAATTQTRGDAVHVLADPRELRRGKVRGQPDSRPLPHRVCHARGRNALAHILRARVLPHDGVVARRAVRAPHKRRLALVRNAHARDVALVDACLRDHVRHGRDHVAIDFLRVVLDPSEVVHDLPVGTVRPGEKSPPFVEEDGFGPLRALVDAQYVLRHVRP